jgi:hypothetical protein
METKCVYDNYEISGCRRYAVYVPIEGYDMTTQQICVETCDDAKAQFWTLYGHVEGQGVEAIGDFASRDAAERVFFRITGEPFTGSYGALPRLRLMHAAPALLAACRMVVARWEHGDLGEAARACSDAIDLATTAMAAAEAAGIPSASAPANPPARFEIEHNPTENSDRVYVLVDGKFDVAIIRTDEGVVVDIYPKEEFEAVASTYAFDTDVEPEQDAAKEAGQP